MVAMMVFAIVIVGGITRLTESGLSITEWKPVSGALPPLSQADWAEAFRKYQAIPEYREINGPAGMTLAQFQFIFFWEWVHRLLGRLIGLALLLPLVWFWIKGQIPAGYNTRLLALVAAVGLQGTIGWWMVASGLSERTDVSHFRLAAHLLIALAILGGLIWTALDLLALHKNPEAKPASLAKSSVFVLIILFIQLLLGAWVAGLNAGQIANTWPLMNDRFVPDGIDYGNGAWFALTHDPYLIHFLHRWWAWIAVIALIVMARKVKAAGHRRAAIAIHSALGLQILLGIGTVLTGVNIVWAVLHQAMGAVLVASFIWGAHVIGSNSRRVL
jgi:cytochrome c oxidase assembly protein subunit 15